MNATKKRQIQNYVRSLFNITDFTLFLHEGGHALVAILSGASVREF